MKSPAIGPAKWKEDVAASKRVLIYGINYSPEPIGVGRYTGELGAYLAGHGVVVEVITAPPHYPGWKLRNLYRNRFLVELGPSVRVIRCPLFLHRDMRGIWRLVAPLSFAITSAPVVMWRILRFRPHTVLCVEPTLFGAPFALFAARLVGAQSVLHVQDLEIDAAFAAGHLKRGSFRRFAQWIEKRVLVSFERVVAISAQMSKKLQQKGVAADRIVLIRNWVDLSKIRNLSSLNEFHIKLGFDEDAFIILYAGNIGAKQGLHVMIEAAWRLRDLARVKFVIAGEGPLKQSLIMQAVGLTNLYFLPLQPEERLCELLNMPHLHFLPQEADMEDLVLPSKLGGMLATDRCILATANPGTELHEFLSEGAILVPAGDVSRVVEVIRKLANEGIPTLKTTGRSLARVLDARHNLALFQDILCAPVKSS